MQQLIESFDHWLFFIINGNNNPFFDRAMMLISGVWIWIPLYAFLLIIVIRKFKSQSWKVLLLFVLLVPFTDQSANGVKSTVKRYRPSHNIELEGRVHLVDNYRGGQYGFVSSHASNVFGLLTLLFFIFKKNRWLISLVFVWACLVSYSRIYLGVHYPLDILGGAIIGVTLAFIEWKLVSHFNLINLKD